MAKAEQKETSIKATCTAKRLLIPRTDSISSTQNTAAHTCLEETLPLRAHNTGSQHSLKVNKQYPHPAFEQKGVLLVMGVEA